MEHAHESSGMDGQLEKETDAACEEKKKRISQ
jgi:hypothetical protein